MVPGFVGDSGAIVQLGREPALGYSSKQDAVSVLTELAVLRWRRTDTRKHRLKQGRRSRGRCRGPGKGQR